MKTKPVCETILPWLRENLGKHCLAPLTGTDAKALAAAVQIIALYAHGEQSSLLEAFANVVRVMQPKTRELAYHAIAHVMDWSDRSRIWQEAGLPQFTPMRCAFEPHQEQRAISHQPSAMAAFTVLELLVATSILAVIVTLLFGIFGNASEAWNKSNASLERKHESRLALEMMEREMACAMATPGATNINFIGSSNRVYFAATTVRGPQYVSDVQEIVYQSEAGAVLNSIGRYSALPTKTNFDVLVWRPYRFDAATTTLAADEKSTLAEGVVSLSFNYISNSGGVQYASDSWDSTTWDPSIGINPHAGKLPLLVEVTIVNMDVRAARQMPASGAARDNYLLRHARTNSSVIHLATSDQ